MNTSSSGAAPSPAPAVNLHNPVAQLAAGWAARGFITVALKPDGLPKKPWKKQIESSAAASFNSTDGVALICGRGVKLLADLDLDWPEAREGAKHFLPRTPAIAGRKSAQGSHRWVMIERPYSFDFKLPSSMKDIPEIAGRPHALCIAELRGADCLATVPGGTHLKSGETFAWEGSQWPDLPLVPTDELHRAMAKVSLFALLRRFAPGEGGRHDFYLTLSGALLQLGFDPEEGDDFILTLAEAEGDEEARQRMMCVSQSRELEAGTKIKGLPALCKELGWPASMTMELKQWFQVEEVRCDDFTSEEDIVAHFNEKYVVISLGSGVTVLRKAYRTSVFGKRMPTFEYRTESALRLETRHRRNGSGRGKEYHYSIWLDSKDRASAPNGFSFVSKGEVPEGTLNVFSGFGVDPVEGDCSLIERHIAEVLAGGDPEMAAYMLKYFAWCFQNPEVPAEVALVLIGERGTGKGFITNLLRDLAGVHGAQVVGSAQLCGGFNARFMDKWLINVDELTPPRDGAEDSIMKSMITEPVLSYQEKGQPRFEAPNRAHIIASTNDPMAVAAGIRERRYAVSYVSDHVQQDHTYFRALRHQIDNGGAAAFLHTMLKMDLGNFHPRRNIPQTKALIDQQVMGLRPVERVILIMVEEGVLPGQACGVKAGEEKGWMHAYALRDFAKSHGVFISERDIGLLLKRKGLQHSLNVRLSSDKNARRRTGYRFPSPTETAAIFFPGMNVAVSASDEWTYEYDHSAIAKWGGT